MIASITVISDVKYGKTYEVKYAGKLSTCIYTDNTVPDDIKTFIDMSEPIESADRFTYTVKTYIY